MVRYGEVYLGFDEVWSGLVLYNEVRCCIV